MRKVVLIILDGWGHSDFEGTPTEGNAIELAHVPNYRAIYAEEPKTRLACSGVDVGLPDGQMGNSEVGHLNLGGGRVVYQDIARVDNAIREGELADRLGLESVLRGLQDRNGTLHVVGLVSDGGVHSHIRHFSALLELLPTDLPVRVHCITDGRDTSPTGGAAYVDRIGQLCARSEHWTISSVTGRYWAMDRDRRWERIKPAFDLIARGKSDVWEDDTDFLTRSYEAGVTDEFVPPTGIRGAGEGGIGPDDAVILMNFRADRMRQLTAALARPVFEEFEREGPLPSHIVTLTAYEKGLPVSVAFPQEHVRQGLAEYLSGLGHTQLKVAETEKYAHVTYFFNGGEETPFPGEVRKLIPSPKVATYDLQPEMSARGVTDAVAEGIASGDFQFILVNFANPDMVGHTGSIPAAVTAVETVDACLGELLDLVADSPEWVALVTADHGNAEKMIDEHGRVHTAHTTEPVDLIVVDPRKDTTALVPRGRLADVAPTVLAYMGIPTPKEMTGNDLVARDA